MCVLLILIILMQRPKQEGLGAAFGGGMMDSVAGAHTTDVLQKGTTWLASIFFGAAILLAILKAQELKQVDPGEVLKPAAVETAPAPTPSISDLPQPPAPAPAEEKPAPEPEAAKTDAPAKAPAEEPAKPATTPAPAEDKPAPAPPKQDKPAPASPPAAGDTKTDQ
ncbi:MAG: preprotein translocase subunit SecG [Verrucomicrobiae bacterium]|nr:preprotein translocase subunit SecG [Verrucomicrobiae bacterium]